MRGAAAELRHHARHAREHGTERWPCDPRHQDIARRDAGKLAFAVHDARASRAPAYTRGMPAEARMAQPYCVGYSRRLHVQRPRLEQLEAGSILRPFDFHRHAHDVLDLSQQPTQLEGLRPIQAWFGRMRM